MPSVQPKPQQFLCKFSVGFGLAILLIPLRVRATKINKRIANM